MSPAIDPAGTKSYTLCIRGPMEILLGMGPPFDTARIKLFTVMMMKNVIKMFRRM